MENENEVSNKKWYSYKEIDTMITKVNNDIYEYTEYGYDSINNKVKKTKVTYKIYNEILEYKKYYKNNETYIQLLMNLQEQQKNKLNGCILPKELWMYILELKYNNDNNHDMNLLLMFNTIILYKSIDIYKKLYDLELYNKGNFYIINGAVDAVGDYKIKIGYIYICGCYDIILCYDKKYRKFFFILNNFWNNNGDNDYVISILNTFKQYTLYLYSYNEIINILQKYKKYHCENCVIDYSNHTSIFSSYKFKNDYNYMLDVYYIHHTETCLNSYIKYDIAQHILQFNMNFDMTKCPIKYIRNKYCYNKIKSLSQLVNDDDSDDKSSSDIE